jgi:hypothetical protein
MLVHSYDLLPFSINELTQSNIVPQRVDEMPVKGGYRLTIDSSL